MAETSYMARFGARLVTNGYAILPIGPGTKKPGRFQRGAWTDYPEWNRHAERPTTEVEVTTWSAWPECGIGIVGGAVAAVDIDIVEDPELALQIEQLARQRLGDTPALRIGRAPKRMLIYRTAAPFRGIKHHPLEVLCLGQQFLAYADHPDTCAPYVWPEEGLADLDITDLPEITTETAAAFLDEAYALLPESLRQRGFSAMSPAAEHLRSHNQVGTRPAIQAALEWLPNLELDYDSWMRVGMALKGALGEAGKDLFRIGQRRLRRTYPRPPPRRGRASNPIASGLVRSITSPWSAAGSLTHRCGLMGLWPATASIQRRGCCRGWMVILKKASKPRRARRSRWRCPTGWWVI